MRFTIIILLILLLSNSIINSEDQFDPVEIETIKNGSKEGELGRFEGGIAFSSYPKSFQVSNDNKIYVCDGENNRINIYDLNLYYIDMILDNDTYISESHFIIIDKKGNIYALDIYEVFKFNKKGQLLFNVSFKERVSYKYISIYKDYILYYPRKEKLYFVDIHGNHISEKEKEILFNKVENENKGTIRNIPGIEDSINDFLKKHDFFLCGDRLLNVETYAYTKFFAYIKDNITDKKIKEKINFSLDYIDNMHFFGFDKYDNSYWHGFDAKTERIEKIKIVVFSKYGENIAYFSNRFVYRFPRVAPNGDIYYMRKNEDDVTFYRVKNTWCKSDEPEPVKKEDSQGVYNADVAYIDSTDWLTYDKDWYMYHGVKAFDGNPKTGWLEGSEGPGIGKKIGITFENSVPVDEIEIMPGYFDNRWWKDNNRVKDLLMVIQTKNSTEEKHEVHFMDKMVAQKYKFNEPKKIIKIEFIVKDIYKASKWDDTAIAEINFYYKGKKIHLNLEKQQKYLKKTTKQQVMDE